MSDPIFDVAAQILERAKLALSSVCAIEPIRTYVATGVIAWDDCCDGQLSVNVTRVYVSTRFPSDAAAEMLQCTVPFTAIEMTVSLLRCVTAMDEDGNPPPADVITEESKRTLLEARAIWRAILCYMFENRDVWSSAVRGQNMLGPEGGFAGSELQITIGLNDGCVCD